MSSQCGGVVTKVFSLCLAPLFASWLGRNAVVCSRWYLKEWKQVCRLRINSWDHIPGRNRLCLHYPFPVLPVYLCSYFVLERWRAEPCSLLTCKPRLSRWGKQRTSFPNELSRVLQLHMYLCNVLLEMLAKSKIQSPVQVLSLNKPAGKQDTSLQVCLHLTTWSNFLWSMALGLTYGYL